MSSVVMWVIKASGWQRGQQLRDRPRLAGQDIARSEFAQRLQHEAPQVCARMRQRERRCAPHFAAERDQVEVERARVSRRGRVLCKGSMR